MTKNTIIIGISGASASGKSLLANTIVKELGSDRVVVISEDSYYKDRSDLTFEERANINYDHPNAFDHDLLYQHLLQLQVGKSIEVPIYNHSQHLREKSTRSIGQHTIVVLEGILLFAEPKLRDLMDIRIYMETALDICLIRRLKRDVKERGRQLDSVLKQYEETVRPMYLQFIEPSKRYADLIVPRGGNNRIAIDLIKAKMREVLGNHTEVRKEHREDIEKISSANEKELLIPKEYMARFAHYDELTSLPNRVFFNEMLNKTISHAVRHDKLLAILFVDIDHFKNILSAVGEKKSNEILREIADRLRSEIREGDIIARFGGNEFIILLNDINQSQYAGSIAEKLLKIISKPFHIKEKELTLTASIGISIFPDDGESLEDLQKKADAGLNKAKQSGGGVYQFYTHEMTFQAHQQVKFDTDLRNAVKNNEFVLFYQPIINLETGTMTGVEALVRWSHPEIGLVYPPSFIPQAEANGMIIPIGEWVLREACRTIKSWQNQGFQPVNVAVNLSLKQFSQPDFVAMIDKVISETNLDPQYLELEITESIMMKEIENMIEKIKQIKKLGVKICIDDFGSGYTAISYLKQLPIDILKIDQEFIKGLSSNPDDVAITSAIIALGHNLGLDVIGEGVETLDQMQFLVDHKCDLVQGYYFSRPLPEDKILLQMEKV